MDHSIPGAQKRPEFKNTGIKPINLLELVQNTAPFLFGPDAEVKPSLRTSFVNILQEAEKRLPNENDLWAYFDLCLASHFATVGTFVPTDVDLAIRVKLWSPVHSESVFQPMWNQVLQMKDWDESGVSHRFVLSDSGKKLSGHQGEWFTVAMGAYGSAHRAAKPLLMDVRTAIEEQVDHQELCLTELRTSFLDSPNVDRMKSYLSGVAAVAHNLGDLDRMFEAWSIEETDVLKRRVFRSGHDDSRNPRPVLVQAGRIYQTLIASENHRNFALRAPKALRKTQKFLLPFGLFLDDWGAGIVEHGFKAGLLSEGDLREIVEALILGWKKLNPVSIYTSQGYSRALAGVSKALGKGELEGLLPPLLRKEVVEGGLRTLLSVSKADFEKKILTKLKVELNRESSIPTS